MPSGVLPPRFVAESAKDAQPLIYGRYMRSPRRLGFLGGTFDPVHIGHLVTAVEVRAQLDLDEVLLVVAAAPWQKIGSRAITPAADRLAVARAAVIDLDGIEVSPLEIERGGTTYTADTLAEVSAADPDVEVFLIVGADVAASLDSWVRLDEIRERATLVTVGRPGSTVPLDELRAAGWRIEHVEVPALDVSSSDLRLRLAERRPIDVIVPAPAVREIRRRGLYSPGR